MTCSPEVLKGVPLFSLLDDDETAILAGQVEMKTFAPRERIYKAGDPGTQAYVLVSGQVQVTTVDEDQQEVIVDVPGKDDFFGFASMFEQTPHQTSAVALEESTCIEVSRNDIAVLIQRKPDAGMDLLTTLGHQLHAAQQLVRLRATRNEGLRFQNCYTLLRFFHARRSLLLPPQRRRPDVGEPRLVVFSLEFINS